MLKFLERFGAGRARAILRGWFFGALRRVSHIEDTREIFWLLLRGENALSIPGELTMLEADVSLYDGLGKSASSLRDRDAIHSRAWGRTAFVTGRFRSGSTLVWNLFRHVPGVTSYYEPFNERRWFDPGSRGGHVDETHLGVSDYWAEYEGLSELGRYFQEDWKFRQLYMPASAWNEPMQRYIETMIRRAAGRAVLQFNEMDFRLGWLRAWFPGVPIIHIFRHPRDQWCSTLLDAAGTAVQCQVREFGPLDGFYLLRWARDLRHAFPFLTLDEDAYAYELYYQVWKLSHLFGNVYADLSLRFEDLIADPQASIRKILDTAGMPEIDVTPLVPLVSPVRIGRWRECASEEWFGEIEARVDAVFLRYAQALNSPVPRRV